MNIFKFRVIVIFLFLYSFHGLSQVNTSLFQSIFPPISKPVLIDNSIFDSIIKENTYAEISKTDFKKVFICWGISPLKFSEFSTARVFAFGRFPMENHYHALIVFVFTEEIGELQFFIAVLNKDDICVEFRQIAQRGGAKDEAFTDNKQHKICMLAGEHIIIMEIPLLSNQNTSSIINTMITNKFSFEKEQFQ